jgi:uncharacterized protein YkwD
MGCSSSIAVKEGTYKKANQKEIFIPKYLRRTLSRQITQKNTKINTEYIQQALEEHNNIRSQHNVEPLEHDLMLSQKAQAHAEELLNKGVVKHSDCMCGERIVGENLIWFNGENKAAKEAVEMWYRESEDYDFDNHGFGFNTAHFTQIVWKGSKYIGVGVASGKGQTYIVCNYYPAGNVQSEFENNVFIRKYIDIE